jgi:endoglucanase
MTDLLEVMQQRAIGWAMWNFRGPFGILESGREDVTYDDHHGVPLDRAMLELLQSH